MERSIIPEGPFIYRLADFKYLRSPFTIILITLSLIPVPYEAYRRHCTLLYRSVKQNYRLKTWFSIADMLYVMKGTIKDLLNIPGVLGYIFAGKKDIQIKLPGKINTAAAKENIAGMFSNLMNEKTKPGNIIEISTPEMAVIIFCSTAPYLMVVTDNPANIPIIRIKGKLAHANLIKEA